MMTGVVEQLPALIGVIVGAVASYLVSSATERRRWERHQSTRWDERRAQAYAEYGYAVKNVYYLNGLIANSRGLGPVAEKIDTVEALSELVRLRSERAAKWEHVLLLGSPETVAAAREWHRLVWDMYPFVHGENANLDEWNALFDEISAARTRFYEAARRDLGIKSGRLPPWRRWESRALAGPASATSETPQQE
jgi:hypothetical protein